MGGGVAIRRFGRILFVGGLFWVAVAGVLLMAAPVIDRVQRLSSPAEAGQNLPPAAAGESALTLQAGGEARSTVQPGRGLRVPPPVRERTRQPPGAAVAQAVPVDPDDPLAEEHPGYGAPSWLKIPTIDLDTPVEPVGIADGHYQTARFRVGHHEDSVAPGALGNSVFNGHVTSLTDGRVFARLHELTTGDTFSIYSESHQTEWEVVAAGWMPAEEDWYVQPTRDIRVTLYTCGGDYDFTRLDYSHRFVVIAGLVSVVPLSENEDGAGAVE